MARFGFGDIVKIKGNKHIWKVLCEVVDIDGSIWYEVTPCDCPVPVTREVKEKDLIPA